MHPDSAVGAKKLAAQLQLADPGEETLFAGHGAQVAMEDALVAALKVFAPQSNGVAELGGQ